MFRLTRESDRARGVTTVTEVVYGLTSLTRGRGDRRGAAGLVSQAHWAIENGLHHVRDVTFGEDRCRVRRASRRGCWRRCGTAAIHLLRREGDPSLAATTRRLAAFPHQAVAMITTPASISA